MKNIKIYTKCNNRNYQFIIKIYKTVNLKMVINLAKYQEKRKIIFSKTIIKKIILVQLIIILKAG